MRTKLFGVMSYLFMIFLTAAALTLGIHAQPNVTSDGKFMFITSDSDSGTPPGMAVITEYCGAPLGGENGTTLTFPSQITDGSTSYNVYGIANKTDYVDQNHPAYGATQIIVSEGIQALLPHAFTGLSNVENVTLPSTLNRIEYDAFDGMKSLSAVNSASPYFYTDLYGALYYINSGNFINYLPTNAKIFIVYPPAQEHRDTYMVEDNTVWIMDSAFRSADIGEIILPNIEGETSLNWLRNLCFRESKITRITIPKSVTRMAMWIFMGCPNLTEVQIDSYSIEYAVIDEPGLYNRINIFDWCSAENIIIKGYSIPMANPPMNGNSIKMTPQYMVDFYNIRNPIDQSVRTPNLIFVDNGMSSQILERKWEYVFADNIIASQQFNQTDWYDFFHAQYLSIKEGDAISFFDKVRGGIIVTGMSGIGGTLAVPPTIDGYRVVGIASPNMFCYDSNAVTPIENVLLPSTLVYIGHHTFLGCTYLKSLRIPRDVRCIGASMLERTVSLSNITVEDGNDYFKTVDGVLFTRNMEWLLTYPAKRGLNGIPFTHYEIPSGVVHIEANAFNHASLKTVNIPLTVTDIRYGAFQEGSLESITIPPSVEYIGKRAFALNNKLSWVQMNAVDFDGGVFENDSEFIDQNMFMLWEDGQKLPFSKNLKVDYYANSSASDYIARLQIIAQSTIMGDVDSSFAWAFKIDAAEHDVVRLTGSTRFTEVGGGNLVTPSEVSYGDKDYRVYVIGYEAFKDRNDIKNVVIDDGPNFINGRAFSNCPNLSSVTISDSVKIVGNSIFGFSTNISEINFMSLRDTTFWNGAFDDVPRNAKVNCFKYGDDYHSIYQYFTNNGFTNINAISPIEEYPAGPYDYKLFDNNGTKIAVITKYRGTGGDIIIPAKVNCNGTEYAVTHIGQGAFANYNIHQEIRWNFDHDLVAPLSLSQNYSDYISSNTFNGVPIFEDTAITPILSVTIPEGVTYIGQNAFANNIFLKSITLPSTLTRMNDAVCIGCYNLTDIKLNYADSNTRYKLNNGILYTKDGMELVMYPIGNKIEYCQILEGTTVVRDYAFATAPSIKKVDLPSSMRILGNGAFYRTISLENIFIPSEVNELNNAFNLCASLKEISVDSFNITYKTDGGVLYTKDGRVLVTYPSKLINDSYIVPQGVTDICNAAFSAAVNLKSVYIPDSVNALGNEAFTHCSSLTNVRLSENITVIKSNTFFRAENLATIHIPQSVKVLDTGCFNFTNFTTITVPSGVTEIRPYAFDNIGTNGINSIYFEGNTIPQIHTDWLGWRGNQEDCSTIIYYKDPQSAWKIYDNSKYGKCSVYFYDPSAQTADSEFNIEDNTIIQYIGTSPVVNIPNKITAIDNNAFAFNPFVTKVIIPQSVNSIGNSAFEGCPMLSEVSVNGTELITSIGNRIFADCTALKTINLTRFNRITDGMFQGCTSLESVSIPANISSVGAYAYSGCSNLTGASFEVGALREIGYNAFSYSGIVGNVVLPQGLEKLSDRVFEFDTSITSVSIPSSIANIEGNPFAACTSLAQIIFSGNDKYVLDMQGALYTADMSELIMTPVGNAFAAPFMIADSVNTLRVFSLYGNTVNEILNIPSNVTNVQPFAVSTMHNLKAFTSSNASITNSVYFADEYGVLYKNNGGSYTLEMYPLMCEQTKYSVKAVTTAIATDAFAGAERLENIIIPESLTTLGYYAFSGCRNLKSVKLPDTLTTIGEEAFYECDSLLNIEIPFGVNKIPNNAFYGCDKLFSISMSNVSEIGEQAFAFNKSLTNVKMSSSLNKIGSKAFAECEVLTSITFTGNPPQDVAEDSFMGCKNITAYYPNDDMSWHGNTLWNGYPVKAYDTTSLNKNGGDVTVELAPDSTTKTVTLVVTPVSPVTNNDISAKVAGLAENTVDGTKAYTIELKEGNSAISLDNPVFVKFLVPIDYNQDQLVLLHIKENGAIEQITDYFFTEESGMVYVNFSLSGFSNVSISSLAAPVKPEQIIPVGTTASATVFNNTTITVTPYDLNNNPYEYAIRRSDDTTSTLVYQSRNVFTGAYGTTYNVYVRLRATNTHNASAHITTTVSIGSNSTEDDVKNAVAGAKTKVNLLITDSFSIKSAGGTTKEAAEEFIKQQIIGAIGNPQITVKLDISEYTPAIDGTDKSQKGTDGKIVFTVTLTGTISGGKTYSETTLPYTVIIKAKTYDDDFFPIILGPTRAEYEAYLRNLEAQRLAEEKRKAEEEAQRLALEEEAAREEAEKLLNHNSLPVLYTVNALSDDTYVYYLNSEGERVTVRLCDNKDGIITFLGKVGIEYFTDENSVKFEDIKSHWANSYIRKIAANGIFVGTGEGIFAPDTEMNGAMLVTVLSRLTEDEIAVGTYDKYYIPYMKWADDAGLLSLIGDFDPEAPLTREKAAVIIEAFMNYIGINLPDADVGMFADYERIDAYASGAVGRIAAAGIIRGRTDGSFDPKAILSRAETSTVISRLISTILSQY